MRTNVKAPRAARRPPDPVLSGELAVRATRTIARILNTLLIILPLLLLLGWSSSTLQENLTLIALLVAVGALALLLRAGRFVASIYLLVAVLIIYGTAAVVAYGSIRSVSVLSFVGAIIVGGIFLGRRALIAAVVLSAVALGALVYAESAGWLHKPDYSVGLVHWAVHTGVIAAIALNVHFARNLVVDALLHARGSEERLVKLFRSNPNVLLTTDLASGRILEINETFGRTFGIMREEAIGATTVELGLWDDPSERAAFLAGAQEQGRVANMPATLKRRNGETFEALMSCEILEVGDTRQLLTTAVDINELVRARAALRSSNERLEKVFRSNPAALTVSNYDTGELVSANAAAERIFGDAAETVVGSSVGYRYWSDPAEADAIRQRTLGGERIARAPVTMKRSNGETFAALISLELIEDGGNRFIVSLIEDVSVEHAARKALEDSEQRFAWIFRNNPAALLRSSLEDARILDMNDSYARMFDLDRSGAIGRSTLSLDLWTDAGQRRKFYDRLLAEGRVENLPVTFKRRGGEAFAALLSGEIFEFGAERQLLSSITDVSEMTRVREALRSSEERLARIFRSSPTAIIVSNFDTRELISANAAAERMFRLSVSEAGTTPGTRFYANPEQAAEVRARLLSEGRVSGFPVQLLRADGERFAGRISQEVLEDAGMKQTITSVEDVSVEYAAREALQLSEQRFSSAFRFSPIGMTITRLSDGTLLEVNDADKFTLGYAREEVLGRKSTETGAWGTPADRERFVAQLRANGRVSNYETRMTNKSGETVDCMVWAAQMDLNGEACVLTAVMNVTERKREEALILDIARGVSGETGAPFFRTLVEHLGRALHADIAIVGEIVPDDRIRTLAMLSGGVIVPNIEYPLEGTPCETVSASPGLTLYPDRVAELFPRDAALARDGMRGYIGISLRDLGGAPIGVLNIVCRETIERTERTEALFRIFAARAQAELLRMRSDRENLTLKESLEQRVADRTAQLQAANSELEAFSYSVSHDLRAPLRAIDGFVRVIAGEQGDSSEALRAKAQERVLGAVKRMNELIDDLLGLAQVTRQEIVHESVDLSALAREVGAELAERAPGRTLEFRVAPGVAVRGDRALMRIVLENLLGNAWKFSARRTDARIEFGAEVQPGGETAYYVRDNGAGFDPEYADRLFAPFQRLHSEREFEGTGIGLATVQRVIARHGGRVWAVSQPERGATFYFTCEMAG